MGRPSVSPPRRKSSPPSRSRASRSPTPPTPRRSPRPRASNGDDMANAAVGMCNVGMWHRAWHTVLLLFTLLTLKLRPSAVIRRGLRIFNTGAGITPKAILSMPEWNGKKFPTHNKYLSRTYKTTVDGDMKTIAEVFESDKYYLQFGVKNDLSPAHNPVLAEVLRERTCKVVFTLLHLLFHIKSVSIWINGQGSAHTRTHFDSEHNLVFVLHGSTDFWTACRDAFEPDAGDFNYSAHNHVNSQSFEKSSIVASQVALQPSEIWHEVFSSARCIKLAVFFD
jgi:hypothetical protein